MWWREYENWQNERMKQNEAGLLATVSKYAAAENGEESEEMKAIGGGAQEFAKKWKDGKEVDDKEDGEEFPQLQRKVERGHGPAVRGRGRGRGEGWSMMEA